MQKLLIYNTNFNNVLKNWLQTLKKYDKIKTKVMVLKYVLIFLKIYSKFCLQKIN